MFNWRESVGMTITSFTCGSWRRARQQAVCLVSSLRLGSLVQRLKRKQALLHRWHHCWVQQLRSTARRTAVMSAVPSDLTARQHALLHVSLLGLPGLLQQVLPTNYWPRWISVPSHRSLYMIQVLGFARYVFCFFGRYAIQRILASRIRKCSEGVKQRRLIINQSIQVYFRQHGP